MQVLKRKSQVYNSVSHLFKRYISNPFQTNIKEEDAKTKSDYIPKGLITQKRTQITEEEQQKLLMSRVFALPDTNTVSVLSHPLGYHVVLVGTHPFCNYSVSILDKVMTNFKPDAYALELCKCEYNLYCAVITGNFNCPDLTLKDSEPETYGRAYDGNWIKDYNGSIISMDNKFMIEKISQMKNPRVILYGACHSEIDRNDIFFTMSTEYIMKKTFMHDLLNINPGKASALPIDPITPEMYELMPIYFQTKEPEQYLEDLNNQVDDYFSSIVAILDHIKIELTSKNESFQPLMMVNIRMSGYLQLKNRLIQAGFKKSVRNNFPAIPPQHETTQIDIVT